MAPPGHRALLLFGHPKPGTRLFHTVRVSCSRAGRADFLDCLCVTVALVRLGWNFGPGERGLLGDEDAES